MSESDGLREPDHQVAFVIVGFVCLLALTLATAYGLRITSESQRVSEERRQEYANDTYGPAKSACRELLPAYQYKCIADADEASRVNARSERDLVAQETSAVWATVMAWTALGGVLLSLLGIYLVFTTFRETRDANLIARKALRMSRDGQRPWIIFKLIGFEYMPAIDLGGIVAPERLRYFAVLANYGSLPSQETRIALDVRDFVEGSDIDSPTDIPMPDGSIIIAPSQEIISDYKYLEGDRLARFLDGKLELFVTCLTTYTDTDGVTGRTLTSFRCYSTTKQWDAAKEVWVPVFTSQPWGYANRAT